MIMLNYKNFKYVFLFLLFLSSFCFSQITAPLTKEEKEYSIKSSLEFEADSKDDFLIYRAFVVKYNTKSHIPNFTIHRLSSSNFVTDNKAKRRSNFYIDSRLGNLSATNNDYKYSGYDRGHMVPAGDFDSDQTLKDETFYLSNICPQNAKLNRGIWLNLENFIRNKVISNNCSAIIITGSIINASTDEFIGSDSVEVPNSFYKIIFFPDNLKMYAFLMSNYYTSYSGELSSYQVRVDDIETLTNENFFDKLGEKIQAKLESQISDLSN